MNEQTNQRCNIDFNIAINVVSAATSSAMRNMSLTQTKIIDSNIIEYAAKLLILIECMVRTMKL